jgi:hypothetical protein
MGSSQVATRAANPERRSLVSRLAETARGMARKKVHTASSPTFPEDLLTRLDSKPESSKFLRRSTFQIGQETLEWRKNQS